MQITLYFNWVIIYWDVFRQVIIPLQTISVKWMEIRWKRWAGGSWADSNSDDMPHTLKINCSHHSDLLPERILVFAAGFVTDLESKDGSLQSHALQGKMNEYNV